MKIFFILSGVGMIAFFGYFLGKQFQGGVSQEIVSEEQKEVSLSQGEISLEQEMSLETFRGRIMEVSPNSLVLGIYETQEPINRDREKMEMMSEDEKQALREETQKTRENFGNPKIVSEKIFILTEKTLYEEIEGSSGFGFNRVNEGEGQELKGNQIAWEKIEEGFTAFVFANNASMEAEKIIIQKNIQQ